MLFVVDWITTLHPSVFLLWPHGRQETSSLPLDFGFLHVTSVGEWGVSGYDANRDFKCAYVINFAFHHENNTLWIASCPRRKAMWSRCGPNSYLRITTEPSLYQ